jgi:tryptophan-rich sensory protein
MSETAVHPRPSPRRAVAGLAVFAVAVVLVAATGGLAADSAAARYQALDLPSWAPPAGVFGPVWTVLYVLIAVAGWLVWRRRGVAGAPGALAAYAVQLGLNALWTPLFFGLGAVGTAFVEICALWIAVACTIVLFLRHSRLAAGLLVPYLAWVTFAAALNGSIWQLN